MKDFLYLFIPFTVVIVAPAVWIFVLYRAIRHLFRSGFAFKCRISWLTVLFFVEYVALIFLTMKFGMQGSPSVSRAIIATMISFTVLLLSEKFYWRKRIFTISFRMLEILFLLGAFCMYVAQPIK